MVVSNLRLNLTVSGKEVGGRTSYKAASPPLQDDDVSLWCESAGQRVDSVVM